MSKKINMQEVKYTEDEIKSLDWREHIRLRPGMYIGKLGDGASADDGIYVLLKEVIDNSIDEYAMGYGRQIDVVLKEGEIMVRDFGRGIPLGKVVDVVSKINTGAKYDSTAFKKSVGLNGVGTKAVNALSEFFKVTAVREGQMKSAEFQFGNLKNESKVEPTKEENGTIIHFKPDNGLFRNYRYLPEYMVLADVAAGRLIRKEVEHPPRVDTVYQAWRQSGAQPGKALAWWLDHLSQDTTRQALLSLAPPCA